MRPARKATAGWRAGSRASKSPRTRPLIHVCASCETVSIDSGPALFDISLVIRSQGDFAKRPATSMVTSADLS
jgi:hypothetical protein